ncbi:MAG: hypothetical protein AB4372_35720 [Xenococcus sp. (in: cyanobacteria)]|nr:hypothetical protein [Xenococcaceae cyanobacterium MO_167.B52]
MANTIWRLDVSSFFDLQFVNDSRELRLSIDVDRIKTSQSSNLITFGVVPVLDLQVGGALWSVRQAKGRIQGVGASVSGLGAYAHVSGSMSFSTKTLETSRTYQDMKKSYRFSAGIGSFWSWIGLGANASYHKQELSQLFNELSQSQTTNGRINIDLYVTGFYPNVPVSASPYILALEVSSKIDSSIKFPVISSGAVTQDTGAQDENEQHLTTKENKSTIELSYTNSQKSLET